MIEVPREALVYQAELTREARAQFGMDAPVALLAGQVMQESGFSPSVCSRYACGLAQFTPGTAAWIGGMMGRLMPADPLNPHWAIRALVTYDKILHDGANPANTECDRFGFSLSDYNGGTRWRVRRQALSTNPGDYTITAAINPGIKEASQRENQAYPFRIVYHWQPVFVSWGGPTICVGKVL